MYIQPRQIGNGYWHQPNGACPNCGYCPHCGRGGQYIQPYTINPIPYPNQPPIIWGMTSNQLHDGHTFTVTNG